MDEEHIVLLLQFILIILLLVGINYNNTNSTYKPKPPSKPPQGYIPRPISGHEPKRNPPTGGSNVRYRKDKKMGASLFLIANPHAFIGYYIISAFAKEEAIEKAANRISIDYPTYKVSKESLEVQEIIFDVADICDLLMGLE